MTVKTVKDLIQQLNSIVEYYELYEEDTELILFSEELPGMARQLDYLDVDFNGNYVQLFMRYF